MFPQFRPYLFLTLGRFPPEFSEERAELAMSMALASGADELGGDSIDLKNIPKTGFFLITLNARLSTARGYRIAHRKWEEAKLQPGTERPGNRLGCFLIFSHFLWAILCPQAI